jgi:hypothetical protein
MTMTMPYIIQGSNITVVIGTTPHTVSKSHIAYNKVLAAIKANDWATVQDIIEPKKAVLNFGKGNIEIQGDKIFWKGREMHNALTKRMVAMIQEDFPVEPLVAFMENLMENPSKRAVTELYGFLEKNTLPITPDGCFLAYKKVRADYLDCHSGSVLNKPAVYMTEADLASIAEDSGKNQEVQVEVVDGVTVVSMERNLVDDDQNRTCSSGLHFCSKEYLGSFGGQRILILKINPRDVVSIPTDYNDSKGRACRYEIVDEIDKDKADEAFAKSVQEAAEKEASIVAEKELASFIKAAKAAALAAALEAAKPE